MPHRIRIQTVFSPPVHLCPVDLAQILGGDSRSHVARQVEHVARHLHARLLHVRDRIEEDDLAGRQRVQRLPAIVKLRDFGRH